MGVSLNAFLGWPKETCSTTGPRGEVYVLEGSANLVAHVG